MSIRQSCPRAAFLVLSLILFFASPSVSAAEQPHCQGLLEQAAAADGDQHWAQGRNVFSESLPSLVVSNVLWLSAVEALRQFGFSEHAEITATFLRTVPIDTGLTALSHAIALGHLPWLKRFLSAEGANPRLEFWARAGANGILGTAFISASWALSGIDLTPEHVAGAFGLCAGVYPVLQATKTYLFKIFPFARDSQWEQRLQCQVPSEAQALKERASVRARELGLSEVQASALYLNAIEALITSRPVEDALAASGWEARDRRIARISARVRWLELQRTLAPTPEAALVKARNIMRQRRLLINRVLELEARAEGDHRQSLRAALDLGAPFSNESSVEFQRVFRDRYSQYRSRLTIASFLDQAIAVGVAGGVFLYSTTYWATHGQWPW